jgi:hypothetical protein
MKDKRAYIHPTQTEISNYFNYNEETGGLITFTNDDLICKNCRYATGSLTTCKKFRTSKPNSAFYTSCDKYTNKDK